MLGPLQQGSSDILVRGDAMALHPACRKCEQWDEQAHEPAPHEGHAHPHEAQNEQKDHMTAAHPTLAGPSHFITLIL